MQFIRTEIFDVVICEPIIHSDDRGYFLETFKKELLDNFIGEKIDFIQDNESKSSFGTIRGLHYQLEPFAQTKLVRVIQGSVLDVAVDLRKNSQTFGMHVAVELNDKNKRQLLIPKGFAHGFAVLSETAIFAYKVDNYFSPKNDRAIIYNDPNLKINWQINECNKQLSNKDLNASPFSKAEYFQ
jgi:dTDP-4-dehydrorhamnose 3,5-epimerase